MHKDEMGRRSAFKLRAVSQWVSLSANQPRPLIKRLSFTGNKGVGGRGTERISRQLKCAIMEPMT